MFISQAFAQGTGAPGGAAPGGGDLLISLFPLLLIFAVMYFLIIRPQNKRMKEHRDLVAAIRRGDTIVTSGGIIAKVTKVVDDNELMVELADGVRVRLVRASVTEVRSKAEPVPAEAKAISKPDAEKADND